MLSVVCYICYFIRVNIMKIKYFVVLITCLVLMQIFKMWNKELYVREQQDAYEFFTSLVDQLDEHLKVQLTRSPLHTQVLIHNLNCVCNSSNVTYIENRSRADLQEHIPGHFL